MIGALVSAHVFVGSIQVVHQPATGSVGVSEVEVRLGHLAPASSTGVNSSTMSATLSGTLTPTTTDVVYVNNTNPAAPFYARLESTGTTGIGNILDLVIGIDNGTAQADQITASLGAVTSTGGAYIRLEPASVNTLYVARTVNAFFSGATVAFDIYVSDDTAESAYVVMTGDLAIS